MKRLVALFLFVVAGAGVGYSQTSSARTLALRCGALFDGRADSVRKNVVIVIEGEKIKSIASSAPSGVTP